MNKTDLLRAIRVAREVGDKDKLKQLQEMWQVADFVELMVPPQPAPTGVLMCQNVDPFEDGRTCGLPAQYRVSGLPGNPWTGVHCEMHALEVVRYMGHQGGCKIVYLGELREDQARYEHEGEARSEVLVEERRPKAKRYPVTSDSRPAYEFIAAGDFSMCDDAQRKFLASVTAQYKQYNQCLTPRQLSCVWVIMRSLGVTE